MTHENSDVRRAALRVFQASKCSGPEVLRQLPQIHQDIGRRLQDVDSRVRGVAALALCRLGCKAAKHFADDLLFILQSGTGTSMVDGAELRDILAALAMLGQSASWAANTVANCLWLEQWSLRRAAAETYGQICGDQRWEVEMSGREKDKNYIRVIWVFPKIGAPQNGWFIMENPIKMG